MALYPHRFNSDTSLKPKGKSEVKTSMKCATTSKKSTTKKTGKGGKKC